MSSTPDLLIQFDDLMRCAAFFLENNCQKEFSKYIRMQETCYKEYQNSLEEVKRLKTSLDAANRDISTLDSKLTSARRWLDSERQQRKKIETEKDALTDLFDEIRRLILVDSYKLSDETREKLTSLSRTFQDSNHNGAHRTPYDRLNTITEMDSTMQSNLSDVSISRSEDDLDELSNGRAYFRKHRAPCRNEEIEITSAKRKRSELPITFTPTAPRAESVESLEGASRATAKDKYADTEYDPKMRTPAIDRLNARTHSFVSKNIILQECCLACEKKIRFGRMGLKCTDCHAIAHPECRDKVPLPCVPMGTPTKPGTMGLISDYAPLVPPMIPAIVIHCINEVEQRGLNEMGIYRIPSVDKEVRILKERFLKCKGAPSLVEIDIHTVCGCLKDFLRNLQDKLIPVAKWNTFADIIRDANKTNKLYQVISTLPQANRDTLAFVILHLQRVACSPACKMPISNLATIFGPTIVGYSSNEQADAFHDAQTANAIMEELLNLSPGYWSSFIVEPPLAPKTPSTLRNTPSTESLMRKTSRKLLATPGTRKRFFNTPEIAKD